MIERYLRRIAECRTLNELNAARIRMNNAMTPIEAYELYRIVQAGWGVPEAGIGVDKAQQITGALRRDTTRIVGDIVAAGKPAPEPFGRRRLVKGSLSVYSDGTKRSGKTLLIGFTGNAARLMMPLPIFLQHLDAASVDLALLTDLARDGYRGGIEGIGSGIEGMIAELPRVLETQHYSRIAIIGTSGGGLPALLTGLKLKVPRVLSVGGNGPDDPRWEGVVAKSARELIAAAAKDALETRVTLAFGAQSPRDRAAAEAMASVVPATLVPVADPRAEVKHVALYPLVGQGRLAGFLGEHLGL